MASFRAWRQRILWRTLRGAAAGWALVIYLARLPVDVALCAFDLMYVNLLKQGVVRRRRGASCASVDALSGRQACAISVKYKNRWLVRVVCPHVSLDRTPGDPYSPCHTGRDGRRPRWWRVGSVAVAGCVALGTAWGIYSMPRRVANGEPAAVEIDEAEALARILDRASQAFEAGRFARAAKLYEDALERDPALADAEFRLGTCRLRLGDRLNARRSFGAAVVLNPKLTRARLALAAVLLAEGETAEAVDMARSVLDAAPTDTRAATVLCDALAANKEYAEAALVAQRFPNDIGLGLRAGKALMAARDFPGAKALLERLIRDGADTLAVRVLLAKCCAAGGEDAAAEQACQAILRRDPNNAWAHLWLAEAYLKRGDLAKARAHADAAQRTAKEDRPILRPAPRVATAPPPAAEPRASKARTPSRAVSHPKPPRPVTMQASAVPTPWFAVAQASSRKSDLELAKRLLRDGDTRAAQAVASKLAMAADFAHASLVYAFIYHWQGDLKRARSEYERVLQLEAGNASAMANLAMLLADEGRDCMRAYQLASKAHRIEPGNFRFQDAYAWALVRVGRHAEAIETLRRLSAQRPKDALVRLHLGQAYFGVGNYERSRRELEAALLLTREDRVVAMARATLARLKQI